MKTAREWKELYRAEREQLGEAGLAALFDRAPQVKLTQSGAIIFPHTRLSASGHLIAAAANAVVQSKCEMVLALGVLHRSDRSDATQRRVHDEAVEADEFSLDNFRVLVEIAARIAKRPPPRIVRRYPFLVGESPAALEGFAELRECRSNGAVLVATTDPIHHGADYDTPAAERRDRTVRRTEEIAQQSIDQQFRSLARRDYRQFLSLARSDRSDFRDVGPVLAELMPDFTHEIIAMELVDYTDVLNSPQPTWVAAALITIS